MNRKGARTIADASFMKVLDREADGRIRTILVPGHHLKRYRVILRRKPGVLIGECALELGENLGYRTCDGNSYGHLCYHFLAAAQVAARDQGYALRFCETKEDAERLNRTHIGKIIMLRAWLGGGIGWAVMTKLGKKEQAQ